MHVSLLLIVTVGRLYSGHLGPAFSCPKYRGVLVWGIRHFRLKLMNIMNYKWYVCATQGRNLAAILGGKRHVAYREQYGICLVVRVPDT